MVLWNSYDRWLSILCYTRKQLFILVEPLSAENNMEKHDAEYKAQTNCYRYYYCDYFLNIYVFSSVNNQQKRFVKGSFNSSKLRVLRGYLPYIYN